MALDPNQNITFEDAEILFRNFTGREEKFNAEGDRNFALLLPPDIGEAMLEDGWNVKHLKPREEGDVPQAYLQVALKYWKRDGQPVMRPPRVVMITSRGRTPLEEDMVSILDAVEIRKIDMTIRPSFWKTSTGEGVKAYLQTMYVTINEDPLDVKYGDLEEVE
jgi:hypothetical protein